MTVFLSSKYSYNEPNSKILNPYKSKQTSHHTPPSPLPPDAVSQAAPSPHYRLVHFDVSGVDLTNSTVVKAEFRIFRAPNPQARAAEQRVEIFQV